MLKAHRARKPDWSTDRDPRTGWLVVTFVCSRWRHVALRSATLWSEVNDYLGQPWAAEFVRRSGSVPLSVTLAESPRSLSESPFIGEYFLVLSAFLESHQSRIRTLEVDEIWDVFGRCPLNRLEELTVHLKEIITTNRPHARNINYLLERLTPSLRHLHLKLSRDWQNSHDTRINWQSARLNGLVTLDLCLQHTFTTEKLPPFLDALCRMPQLSVLALKHDFARPLFPMTCEDSCPCRRAGPYHLRQLTKLVIHNSFKSVAHVLLHLRMPSSVHMILNGNQVESNTLYGLLDSSKALAEATVPSMQELPPFRAATIHCSSDDTYYYPGSPEETNVSLTRSHQLPPTEIDVRCTCSPGTIQFYTFFTAGFFQDLASNIDLHGVRTLSLHRVRGELCAEVLKPHTFPGLEFLRLSPGGTQIRNLDMVSSAHSTASSSSIPFLKLRVLDLVDFTLRDVLTCTDGLGNPKHPQWKIATRTALENIIHVRRELGTPPMTVYLHVEEEIAALKSGEPCENFSCDAFDKEGLWEAATRLESLVEVQIVKRDKLIIEDRE
ncbi:hypothetical protein PENSPDRAFT_646547 [Peniophora sp. CONT]|nr:hypothetical protein PENSPDRAFT_646547 [Peniophora sp. CONT]